MKILVSCANGAATSLMMRTKVEQALKELNVTAEEIHHCSIADGKQLAKNYDVVFCSINFADLFQDAADSGVKILGLQNILSIAEAKTHLENSGLIH